MCKPGTLPILHCENIFDVTETLNQAVEKVDLDSMTEEQLYPPNAGLELDQDTGDPEKDEMRRKYKEFNEAASPEDRMSYAEFKQIISTMKSIAGK